MRKNLFRPAFDTLESRTVPSSVQITNKPLPPLEIISGAEQKTVATMEIKTTGQRDYARLQEAIFISALDSADLTNVQGYYLQMQIGNTTSTIAQAHPDYDTGLVDFQVYQAFWIRPGQTAKLNVVADFQGILDTSNSDQFGVELAEADFSDLHNMPVPDSNVSYVGVPPVMHHLDAAQIGLGQSQMAPGAMVKVGDKHVDVFDFNVWNTDGALSQVSVAASLGSIGLGSVGNFSTKYTLGVDVNYDGKDDSTYVGHMNAYGDKMIFDFPEPIAEGQVHVYADAVKPSAAPYTQFVFGSATGVNTVTGKPLQGVAANAGEGQVRIYYDPTFATIFTKVVNPEVFVKEIGAANRWDVPTTSAKAGDLIALDTFVVSSASDFTFTHLVESSFPDTGINAASIVLMADIKGDGKMVQVATGTFVFGGDLGIPSQIIFDFNQTVIGGKDMKFVVQAKVATNANGPLTASLAPMGAITGKRPNGTVLGADKVFESFAFEPYYWVGEGPYG